MTGLSDVLTLEIYPHFPRKTPNIIGVEPPMAAIRA